MKVGFVGLGNQGSPIAGRIAHSGQFDTAVWARRAEALEPFRDGSARIAASVGALAEGLDVLVTCVFDAEGTREILFGSGGAASVLAQGAVIVCHSTLAPQEIADIAADAEKYGLRVLDAPVSGGPFKAAAGEMIVMVGGDQATYEYVVPVLNTYADQIVYLGGIGAGQQAKLLNNTMLAAHIGIANDVFQVARELGLDPKGLGEILRNGSGRSYGVEVFIGSGSLDPMVNSTIQLTLSKDVDLLSRTIKDLTAGSVLLAPAQAFIHELEALNAEAS
jgi:3-hydroxyisobutyrate dehydrogenase-like beta-hydroxyacid dehydrogenase